jgi:hypothetical protein
MREIKAREALRRRATSCAKAVKAVSRDERETKSTESLYSVMSSRPMRYLRHSVRRDYLRSRQEDIESKIEYLATSRSLKSSDGFADLGVVVPSAMIQYEQIIRA